MDKEIRDALKVYKQEIDLKEVSTCECEKCSAIRTIITLAERYLKVGMPEEDLAELEHEKWAGWMKWIWEKCPEELFPDGNNGYLKTGRRLILKETVDRWERQMLAAYKDLSDEEKESDRIEARKSINKYRLWLAKRLDDVRGILAQAYRTERNKHKEVDATLIVDMEELLRKHLGGQDG